jgi:hypothetical protein
MCVWERGGKRWTGISGAVFSCGLAYTSSGGMVARGSITSRSAACNWPQTRELPERIGLGERWCRGPNTSTTEAHQEDTGLSEGPKLFGLGLVCGVSAAAGDWGPSWIEYGVRPWLRCVAPHALPISGLAAAASSSRALPMYYYSSALCGGACTSGYIHVLAVQFTMTWSTTCLHDVSQSL